ncbi:MAG: DUF3012 domain-containing protein [Desulfuromonas sp.]|nr:MAG: DUF3012 domain-containing protein [Desulfuromonas sp.]
MKSLSLALLLFVFIMLCSSCTPERGTKAWCEMMEKKPKGEWSANDLAEYTKSCVFRKAD